MKQRMVSTKLKLPQPRKNYIVRGSLFMKLEQMKEKRLLIVKGSAGSGKTTLVTSYIKEEGLENVKWISLDETCNNLFVFWNYVVEELLAFASESKADYLSIFNANNSRDDFNEMLTLLINEINFEQDIYLFLDDFHYIDNSQTLESLTYFLLHMPENIHLVLLSRITPSLYLSKLEIQGELQFIDEKELLFSKEEASLFLKNTLSLNLSNEMLESMVDLAEGWIGGLQLIASASFRKDTRLVKLTSRDYLIHEYMEKEIFSLLSEQEQQFLLYTSIFSYFDKDISELLFPEIFYYEMLEQLLNKNLLLQCIDEEQMVYRYHHILKDYLNLQFQKIDMKIQRQIHKKAVAYFLNNQEYENSIHHLLILKDYEKLMQVVLQMPQNATTFAYIEQVPVSVITKNFEFAFQKFFYHYSNAESAICYEILKVVSPYMESDKKFKAFRGVQFLLNYKYPDLKIKTISSEELASLEINDITKGLVLIRNASLMFYQENYQEALSVINLASKYSHNTPNTYLNYFLNNIKAQIYEEIGAFKKSLAIYEQLEKSVEIIPTLKYMQASYHLSITGVYLKQMRLSLSLKHLEQSKACNYTEEINYTYAYQYNMCEYLFLMEKDQEALPILMELLEVPVYTENILTLAGLLKYAWRIKQLPVVVYDQFMENYQQNDDCDRSANSHLLYARCLSNKQETKDAVIILDTVLGEMRKAKNHLKIVEAALAKLSIVLDSESNYRILLDLYREAIYYACDDEIKLPFYFDKEVVNQIHQRYGEELLGSFSKKEKSFYMDILKACKQTSKIILSGRELEVLHEIANGLSNKEVAEKLCISLATVKSHMIHMYRKLEVNSRVSAVQVAKDMNLFE